jgi:hypothetical protein
MIFEICEAISALAQQVTPSRITGENTRHKWVAFAIKAVNDMRSPTGTDDPA